MRTQIMNHLKFRILLLWCIAGVFIPIYMEAENFIPVFISEAISDSLFLRMQDKSYKGNCTVPRDELRHLIVSHYDFEHQPRIGELVCHQSIANDLLDIFKNLYDAEYEIEKIQLIDQYDAYDELSMSDNNSSSFNYRTVAGTKKMSNHSKGLAIDINPLYNPYVRKLNGKTIISPEKGIRYADRNADFPHKLTADDICVREFKRHGFTWGGDWTRSKDYQHFEKRTGR